MKNLLLLVPSSISQQLFNVSIYYPISSISVLVSDEMMMSICDVYFKIILKIMMVKVPIYLCEARNQAIVCFFLQKVFYSLITTLLLLFCMFF